MSLRPQHVAPELLNKVTKALGITALDQWYYVPHHKATKVIGSRALNEFGGTLSSFLKHAYQEHHFDEAKLITRNHKEKDQQFVGVLIKKLFPNEEIHTKARKVVGIINPETEEYLEIDFWIPSLKLGIEYQDKHHYGYQWYANDTLENYQKRDYIKKDAMSTLGYTLVSVGYWWDKSIESLAATIRKHRPDLLQDYERNPAEPIPSDPPIGYTTSPHVIPGVAGIMSPFVPNSKFDPTNWYGGEKHDGIRGVYNPNLNKMFSRAGNELSVHSSLLNDIPSMLVEGEITAGRGNYTKTTGVSFHTHQDKVNWPMFRYIIFDIPNIEFEKYMQRYSVITTRLLGLPFVFAQSAFRVLLSGKSHLKLLMDAIINDGGEGVIAQQDSRYEFGRATGLAKIKVHRDADAQVLHISNFACTCTLVSGITADINFCDDFDPSNLKVGDIISYYHNGYTKSGLPKRAEIYKIRYDINWVDLISDNVQRVAKSRSIQDAIGNRSLLESNTERTRMGRGYWNKSANVRAFFDEFARTSGFDPLVPENWYPVRVRTLEHYGGGGLLKAYRYLKNALPVAYPELKFETENYISHQIKVQKGHWNTPSNARAFFDEFARTSGFDPLIPENWYPVTISDLQNAGGESLLAAHFHNKKNALSCAYPVLKFEARKFNEAQNNVRNWTDLAGARSFFEYFARMSGFDPLVPDNWYLVRGVALRNAGGTSLLRAYGFNLKNTLLSAYPELKFEAGKFITHQAKAKNGHWNKPQNVRVFFDEFAQTAGFDPLEPVNWDSVSVIELQDAGGGGLLNAYRYDVKQALAFAYPEVMW